MRTVPRRYRVGRRGRVLLTILATCVALVGSMAVASAADFLPDDWSTLASDQTETTKPWRPTQPRNPALGATPAPLPPPPSLPPPDAAPPHTEAPPAPPQPKPEEKKAPEKKPEAEKKPEKKPEEKSNGPAASLSGPEASVVALTNQRRADAGCGQLSTDQRLANAAQGHVDDMAANGYFAHNSQDGRTFDQRIRAAGYPSPGGENIAQGQQSAEEVVQAWMDSPGHRRNILDCSYKRIGTALNTNGMFWAQEFGR
ncbi:CAP domain-containing protein [Actinomycetes bacterium KLBMP 9759]